MGEWVNPAPLELERNEREVNGVIESYLTNEAEAQHRQHLEISRQERIRAYQQKVANLATSLVVENLDTYQVASD